MPTANSNGLLRISEVANLLHSHPNSVRAWSNNGTLPCYRINGNHRRWKKSDVLAFLGEEVEEISSDTCLIYARVSTNKQSSGMTLGKENSLSRQIDKLKEYAQENFPNKEIIVFSDTASGLSYSRKSFNRLIDNVLAGKYDNATLILAHKDRLARFATELIEKLFVFHNITIVYTEDKPDKSNDQEMAEDLLSIIHSFSCKHYSARGVAVLTKHLTVEALVRLKALRSEGLNYTATARQLNKENFKCTDNGLISLHVVKNHCKEQTITKEKVLNTVAAWISDNVQAASSNTRIVSKVAYSEYCQWCEGVGYIPSNITIFGKCPKNC